MDKNNAAWGHNGKEISPNKMQHCWHLLAVPEIERTNHC
jgi:hypothetical protein